MAILSIITAPDPRLKAKARRLARVDDAALAAVKGWALGRAVLHRLGRRMALLQRVRRPGRAPLGESQPRRIVQ